jgi:archaemetzincin
MRTPIITMLLICITIAACRPDAPGTHPNQNTRYRLGIKRPKTPPAIRILPLGKTRPGQARQVEQQLKAVFKNVAILPARPMPKNALSRYEPRWRADTILTWMKSQIPSGQVWIAVTREDISHTKGKDPDYGIMGLGLRPGNACVVSDARLKVHRTDGFPKIVLHELGHTAGLHHCPDKSCTMQDAEGKNVTPRMQGFCSDCLASLKSLGWQL